MNQHQFQSMVRCGSGKVKHMGEMNKAEMVECYNRALAVIDEQRGLKDELERLRADNARLREALMDPPADVQEAVIKKLQLVSGEAMDLLRAENAQLKARVAELEGELGEARNIVGILRGSLFTHQSALKEARSKLIDAQCALRSSDGNLQKRIVDEIDSTLRTIQKEERNVN